MLQKSIHRSPNPSSTGSGVGVFRRYLWVRSWKWGPDLIRPQVLKEEREISFCVCTEDRHAHWRGGKHTLRVENCVLFGGFSEDLNSGQSLSDSSKGLLLKPSSALWGSWAHEPFCVPNFLFLGSKLQPPWPTLSSKGQGFQGSNSCSSGKRGDAETREEQSRDNSASLGKSPGSS